MKNLKSAEVFLAVSARCKSLLLESYVTAKALDDVYLMIGEEERAIRKDPLGAAGSLAKKVFGALH